MKKSVPHRSAPLLATLAFFLSATCIAQNPYNFYGGDIEADRKNPAIEDCEYEELVEKQRCNLSLNKTSCIARILEECQERFRNDESAPQAPENQSVEQERQPRQNL